MPQPEPQARAEKNLGQEYSPEESVFFDREVILNGGSVYTPPWTEYSPWSITCCKIKYTLAGNTLVESSGDS